MIYDIPMALVADLHDRRYQMSWSEFDQLYLHCKI